MSNKVKTTRTPVGELSNDQIDQAMKWSKGGRYIKTWGGCFMKDELADMIPEVGKFYIINIGSSDDPETSEGTHWVLVANKNNYENYIVYVDPYGMEPPEEILAFMKRAKRTTKKGVIKPGQKKIIVNTMDLQNYYDDACGWYCIYIAKQLQANKSLITVLKQFDYFDTWRNREVIEKLNTADYFHFL